jgi:hypothetical protein
MSETIPGDPDRDDDGAIDDDVEPDEEEGGTGPDDGGPGSQNM